MCFFCHHMYRMYDIVISDIGGTVNEAEMSILIYIHGVVGERDVDCFYIYED